MYHPISCRQVTKNFIEVLIHIYRDKDIALVMTIIDVVALKGVILGLYHAMSNIKK